MTAFEATFLGVVQGLTEFLPISSSAHLILARAFFGWDFQQFGLVFDVACHVGTLLAVVVYFRRELVHMVAAAPTALNRPPYGPGRLLYLLVLGTLPIIVVGLTFADIIETAVRTVVVSTVALALGGLVLLVVERVARARRDVDELSGGEAVYLGVAQALALIPGVSRSGAILAVGMFLGLRREAAARFAFLLSIPAITAAAGRETLELAAEGVATDALRIMVIGMVVSAIVGYFTVKYFIRYVARHSLDLFAIYRLGLAAAALVWLTA